MSARRVIAHLDMDAFYVSVELLRRPELRGKPVVISGTGPRAVVTTASYEARPFGVRSAIPAARARQLCPQAIFLPVDMAHYKQVSGEVMERIAALEVPTQRLSLDEAYLDLSDVAHPVHEMSELVRRIREELSLDASVGVGPNKLVAKVASDAEKPRGFVILSREQAMERFADFSPRLIPGIGPKTAKRLEGLGISTLAELRAFPLERLEAEIGPTHGRHVHERAHFEDDSPVAERAAKSRSVERTFDRDVSEIETIERVLCEQAGRLSDELVRRGLSGRTVAIKVRLDDFTTVTRARTLERPLNDEPTIARVACELVRAYDPPRPVRLLGVRVAGFDEMDEGAGPPRPPRTGGAGGPTLFEAPG